MAGDGTVFGMDCKWYEFVVMSARYGSGLNLGRTTFLYDRGYGRAKVCCEWRDPLGAVYELVYTELVYTSSFLQSTGI